jgi:tRNA pseudouridine38-40 synthase|tara:strand:- start:736 stop:1599 length:864 start_codon:yes stop_codon:yes gene_type:complete
MVAFGYHGDLFHGSQIQPNVPTVQKAIENALRKVSWWSDGCLEMSSRTDAGVSVRMNLACIDVPITVWNEVDKKTILRVLNNRFPEGLCAWDVIKVESNIRSRAAKARTYLFRTELIEEWSSGIDDELFLNACKIMIGTHDFTNFCKLEEDKNPIRTIDMCEPWYSSDGRIIGILICSEAFLWNQVRRIAAAITGVAVGRIKFTSLESALNKPEIPLDLGRAQSNGLILWSIEHQFSQGMGLHCNPDTIGFSIAPKKKYRFKRWLSMAKLEMGLLLERDWEDSLNSI